ncbi:phosphoribosylformylglycinamidine cyclo-ligase [Caldanaerobius fijiensis DSM 17918]|uniref:Phosphoribosylformylglycinamidine cyclo-ligase n=1 Tax=Caldanaerobius fijiensis DSM 17918 TaxID=1121256 RepID=A0A1M5A7L1_9THEO|nr:phosphoribosylformylglycinamidine cyclo-ligase [Caldanaerobius fijiensis]SHF25996.1 phosphoribosylformylglycinamidine cyclo-ligase [Caldanaerobius fijiensis DSM 17918]
MADYKEAGVNIDEGNRVVELIKGYTRATFIDGVIGGIGSFGGLFEVKGFKNPVLVSGTDGVGTKLKIAQMMEKHDTVGIDCVAMCANDVACHGAQPLFFLDYVGIGLLRAELVAEIVKGVAEGCKQAECALIGGETAELSGIYAKEDYDLVGFCVGAVEKDAIIDGKNIRAGDALIGLVSSGIHSNGYTLVRHVFFNMNHYSVSDYIPELGCTLGEELIKPTRIYVKTLKFLRSRGYEIKGIAHITGGGFIENIPRILPHGLGVKIFKGAYEIPPIFDLIQKLGDVPELEMYRTFNMGIGMVLVVDQGAADDIVKALKDYGDNAYIIGIVTDKKGVEI